MPDAVPARCDAAFSPEQPWFVLSAARHYSLIASENPLVSHFYSFDVARPTSQPVVIPDGCVDILFDCDPDRPAASVCGSPLQFKHVELAQGHHYFGVRFAPGVIPDFPRVAAAELADQEFGLLEVIPGAGQAFEQIVQSRSFVQQTSLFNRYFTPHLSRTPAPLTARLIGEIRKSKGNVRINQLETLTGYTSRTIQRQFRQDTGMSPKAFSRFIRCQSALSTMQQPGCSSFLEQALDLGFSDQAHFQREFKTLVGHTPLDYQRQITREAYRERIRFN